MKGDIIYFRTLRRAHLKIGEQRFRRLTMRFGDLKCRNCLTPIAVGDEIVTLSAGVTQRHKIWCGACAKRLLII